MVDVDLLKEYYKAQNDISGLEYANEQRKSALKLAILRVVSLNTPNQTINGNDEVTVLKKRINEFELYVNKIKQESSTKYRLLDGKFEASKQEILRLKQQLKSTSTSTKVETNASRPRKLTKPPFLSAQPVLKNYLSPSFNSITTLNEEFTSNILTPIAPRQQRVKRKYVTALNFSKFEKNALALQQSAREDEPVSKSTTSPLKTPSKMKFIANFDKSEDNSDSDTPEFTPTKTLSTSTPTDKKVDTTDASIEPPSKKKRAKKLILRKSIRTNISLGSGKPLDYDDMNFLNYDDENILNNMSPKLEHSAKFTDAVELPLPKKKKKKNVFHID